MTKTYKNELFEFAFFPKWDNAVAFLAENLADREDWDFSDSTAKKYSVFTFFN
jgi:hypothetical protein